MVILALVIYLFLKVLSIPKGTLLCTGNIVVFKTQSWSSETLGSSEITSMQGLFCPNFCLTETANTKDNLDV